MKKLFNVFAPLIFIILFFASFFTRQPFLSIIIVAVLYFFSKELVWFFSTETHQKSPGEEPGDMNGSGEFSPLGYSPGVYAAFSGTTVEFFDNGKSAAFWRRDNTGRVISREGRVMEGNIRSYYYFGGAGSAKTYIKIVNNEFADNEIIWLRPNGARYITYEIDKDGVYNGKYNSYYHSGALNKTAWLSDGMPLGRLKQYYACGAIMKRVEYKNSLKDGLCVEYYTDTMNTIKRSSSFVGGKLTGYVRKYYMDGVREAEIYYKNNVKMMETLYNTSGLVESENISVDFEKGLMNNSEFKGMKRRMKMEFKLAKYGMEMFDPRSDAFPRIRAIRRPGSAFIMREFSCEEELIKFVLKAGFKSFVGEQMKERRNVVRVFNADGRLVREK
jgi:antitoxin component YwqK of YwqJK toxin-antitoxin module